MITLSYVGGFGNTLFQYAYARLLAERNGLWLDAPPPPSELVKTTPHKAGSRFDAPAFTVDENTDNLLLCPLPQAHYHLNGFFQKGNWYTPHIAHIKEFLAPANEVMPAHPDDIVLHLRLGDYPWSKWISAKWYCDILRGKAFRNLYVVATDPQPRYLEALKPWNPIVVKPTDGDWDFIRSFRRVIMSNSTYCWWAVFFGHARESFAFKPWMGVPTFHLSDFPGMTPVDGLFDIEVPR
jgi:hypothetical protein